MKITTHQVHGVLKNYTRKLRRRWQKEDATTYEIGASHMESRRHSIVKKITSEILEQISRSSQRLPESGQAREKTTQEMQRSTFAYQTIDNNNCRSVRSFTIHPNEASDRSMPSEPETPT